MTKILPRWLSALLIAACVLGALYLLGNAQNFTGADDFPGVHLEAKNIEAPDFTATTIDGKPFHLKDLRGKVVLLNFWATWCGPCKEEIPDLIALQKKYAGKDFVLVGIADDNPEMVKKFAQDAGMTYPLLIGTPEVLGAYGASGLPTSVLIGKDGKIKSGLEGVDMSQSVETMWSRQIDRAL